MGSFCTTAALVVDDKKRIFAAAAAKPVVPTVGVSFFHFCLAPIPDRYLLIYSQLASSLAD